MFFVLIYFFKNSNFLPWILRCSCFQIRSELGFEISTSKLYLKVEFYPIDVETGLILNFTRHLFFLQVKSEILVENVYCPAEEAILLASYAVQAKVSLYNLVISTQHSSSFCIYYKHFKFMTCLQVTSVYMFYI